MFAVSLVGPAQTQSIGGAKEKISPLIQTIHLLRDMRLELMELVLISIVSWAKLKTSAGWLELGFSLSLALLGVITPWNVDFSDSMSRAVAKFYGGCD